MQSFIKTHLNNLFFSLYNVVMLSHNCQLYGLLMLLRDVFSIYLTGLCCTLVTRLSIETLSLTLKRKLETITAELPYTFKYFTLVIKLVLLVKTENGNIKISKSCTAPLPSQYSTKCSCNKLLSHYS